MTKNLINSAFVEGFLSKIAETKEAKKGKLKAIKDAVNILRKFVKTLVLPPAVYAAGHIGGAWGGEDPPLPPDDEELSLLDPSLALPALGLGGAGLLTYFLLRDALKGEEIKSPALRRRLRDLGREELL